MEPEINRSLYYGVLTPWLRSFLIKIGDTTECLFTNSFLLYWLVKAVAISKQPRTIKSDR